MTERMDRKALAAALVTVVFWASAFVGLRAVAPDFSPGSIALGRLAVGSLALGLLVAVRPWRHPSRRDLGLIIASGVLWFALYQVVLSWAERLVDAGTAAMLVNTGPLFIAILAGIFLGEGLPRRLLLGLAIAFGGTLIIAGGTTGDPIDAPAPMLGIVLCIVAALAYAAAVTLQKPVLRRVSALEVTFLACLTGTIVCLPFLPGLLAEASTADPVDIGWIVYLGVFPTAIAITTWAYALGRTSAGRLGSMTYLVPPVVIAMSWIVLGEAPSGLALLGGAICIGGVVIARSPGLALPRRLRPAGRRIPRPMTVLASAGVLMPASKERSAVDPATD